jgi:hypothetical protein
MSGDYLWDKSGSPDPEIEKIEQVMGKLRFDRPSPVFPIIEGVRRDRWTLRLREWFRPTLAASFAAILIVCGLGLLWRWKADVAAGWNVTQISGKPRIEEGWIGSSGRVGVGQVLETDQQSRAEIQLPEVGRVEIDPDTRVRVLKGPRGVSRLALDRGTIHARIWALPGLFVVDTPSARAVDLGCAYTLQVDDTGDGLIRTSMGWVGFKLGDREAFIPAGAACKSRAKSGPGIPYFEDVGEKLRQALVAFDLSGSGAADRKASLDTILDQARPRDALTLWHLLSRVDVSDRARVYERLAAFVPPPANVTREGIQRLDPNMLDSWWNSLDLGNIWLWRHWERSWSQSQQAER